MTCSSALGWILFEVTLFKVATYLVGIEAMSIYELIAVCSYKFVG